MKVYHTATEKDLIEMHDNNELPSFEFWNKHLAQNGGFEMDNAACGGVELIQQTVIDFVDPAGYHSRIVLAITFDMIDDVEELDDQILYEEENGFKAEWMM
jgi:hypothetical protein